MNFDAVVYCRKVIQQLVITAAKIPDITVQMNCSNNAHNSNEKDVLWAILQGLVLEAYAKLYAWLNNTQKQAPHHQGLRNKL